MKKLKYILRKIGDIRHAMLRSKVDHKTTSFQMEALNGNDESIEWVVTDDIDQAMVNREVSIVQKLKDDYIYITGLVTGQRSREKSVLSIHILKACWMVKRTDGNLTWLDEKMVYEAEAPTMRLAS